MDHQYNAGAKGRCESDPEDDISVLRHMYRLHTSAQMFHHPTSGGNRCIVGVQIYIKSV